VSGIVGAGGNAGAVFSGFLLKTEGLSWHTALFILGALVTTCSFLSLAVKLGDDREPARQRVPWHDLGVGTPEPAGVIA
jgi:NNP family nitrate/nitrite transporter-like MFS transporter